MRIIERKDAKYLLFGILEISEKKRENHSNSEKKHFERKEASQMCLASFHIKRDTEKSISANLGIFLPRQCPCSRTTVLKNTRRRVAFLLSQCYNNLCSLGWYANRSLAKQHNADFVTTAIDGGFILSAALTPSAVYARCRWR